MKCKIEFTKIAEKSFSALPRSDAKKIKARIEKLGSNPFPHDCKKIEGLDDVYRVRQGDYRILYSVFDAKLIVLVLKIGHRREIYR